MFLASGHLKRNIAATTCDGHSSFLEIRAGPPNGPSLLVPRAMSERGVPNIPGANILVGEEAESLAWDFFAPGGMLDGVEPVSLVRVTGDGVAM